MKIQQSPYASFVSLVVNLVWVYLAYFLCRLAYLFENWSTFAPALSWPSFADTLRGGLLFDTSAIVYTNALYILMMLLPLHLKENNTYHRCARCLFIFVNALCIAANLADAVFFQYTGRRTTSTIFAEFGNENNLLSIIGIEMLRHWYLVLLALLMIAFMWRFYLMPRCKTASDGSQRATRRQLFLHYLVQIALLAISTPMCIFGMRGGIGTAVRPITVSNANQYVSRPADASLVLNTPFSIIRTYGKAVFSVPSYMDDAQMNSLYTPLHTPTLPQDTTMQGKKRKNVVVLIVESFGREYVGALNTTLDGGRYKGYTPFIDSLLHHSVTFAHSFANGRKSIDGMPSVLSAIPMFVEPFFLTPASMNSVSGIAGELGKEGYYSAFFHGAENGSMGFQAFARASGFNDYFGRTEYDADGRFGGDADFDGTWAIWDEPFLQFFATKTGEFREPFVSAVFTASSHHPFAIPAQYEDVFAEGDQPIHRCIGYTDHALRRFFESARRQPWYDNTLFVITADHHNQTSHAYYETDLGRFAVPIIFFDPSGTLQPGIHNAIAQQTDIMPTVLGYVGYDRPYVAFGCDLLATPPDETWAVNYQNGIYQYVKDDYLLRFDGNKTTAMYRFKTDSLLQTNILAAQTNIADGQTGMQTTAEASADSIGKARERLENELKAIIRSYMIRMTSDSLTAGETPLP